MMSKNPISIGLSDEQANQLMRLQFAYQAVIGHNISDPAVWFGCHLGIYLSALCVGAAVENQQPRGSARLQREALRHRQNAMRAFHTYLGRTPTADDLINELAQRVAVPDFVAEAIRRDIARPPSK
jgi:hypothetical protein